MKTRRPGVYAVPVVIAATVGWAKEHPGRIALIAASLTAAVLLYGSYDRTSPDEIAVPPRTPIISAPLAPPPVVDDTPVEAQPSPEPTGSDAGALQRSTAALPPSPASSPSPAPTPSPSLAPTPSPTVVPQPETDNCKDLLLDDLLDDLLERLGATICLQPLI
ncbi:MAG: hypothetical protein ACRD0W_04750 [Acidimicrobiales bacterium]